ncbi:hypothetical protein MMC25_006141 [Agyrium rufum]|nr:hypothetical protein [Agyrium rufum]
MVSTRRHPTAFPPPDLSPSKTSASLSSARATPTPSASSPAKNTRSSRNRVETPPSPSASSKEAEEEHQEEEEEQAAKRVIKKSRNGSLLRPTMVSATSSTAISKPSNFVHRPSLITLIWLAVSLPLVVWDTSYVFLRPHSMPGGALHWPIWTLYGTYVDVDYMYGWPAYESGNGFTAAQATLNVIETVMYVWYLWKLWQGGEVVQVVEKDRTTGWRRLAQRFRVTMKGREAAKVAVVGLIAAAMTEGKTVLYSRAAIFHLPLAVEKRDYTLDGSRNAVNVPFKERADPQDHHERGTLQQNLRAWSLFNHEYRDGLWGGVWPRVFYTIAALGNPPQPFRLAMNLAWDTLFIPSVDCIGQCNRDGDFPGFQSNLSLTYQPGSGALATTAYEGVRFQGRVDHDTLHIADLEVNNQAFINVDEARMQGWLHFYNGFEGVLGLAPRWNSSVDEFRLPSPWLTMVNQSILDRNLFAIDLPRDHEVEGIPQRPGEISFGGINPKHKSSDFVTLPLSDYTDRAWTIEAQSVTWENSTHPLHFSFTNFTLAGYDNSAWYMALPGTLADEINAQVQYIDGNIYRFVHCDRRHELPDIILRLAGQEVRISAMDYSLPFREGLCFFMFVSSERLGFPVDAIVLGAPALASFYSVFDVDRREVRLAKLID